MDKKDVVHIHNGIYAAIRKEDTLPFATTWVELEHIMLSKINSNIKTSIVMISLKYIILQSLTSRKQNNRE